MWFVRLAIELLGTAGAARNAGSVLRAERLALAEVDSVVDRLQRHVAAVQPAA